MANYNNPLHPPVTNASQFTAIGSAVNGGPSAPRFVVPGRRRLPQTMYTPASKWKNTTGRMQPLRSPIFFDFKGYQKQGVPMMELSARGIVAIERMIQDGTEKVLEHTPLKRITFRIIWPGYEHVEWYRSIELHTSSGPITRAELGQAVAQNFARYCEKTQYERTNAMEWRLGPGGINVYNLVLISVCNVFEDSWQADVAVDM